MPSLLTRDRIAELRQKYPGQFEGKPPAAPETPPPTATGGEDQPTPTRAELYERAKELNIEGRSSMDAAQLQVAITEAEAASTETDTDESEEGE